MAQAAGAVAMVVINNVAGDPITMGGTDPRITIPSVMISQADGNTILSGVWPVLGSVSAEPPPPPPEPYLVTIDAPSPAAGTYLSALAVFGPEPTVGGVSGGVALVSDGSASPTLGCGPLTGFSAGSIALVDRGECTFVEKALNAQAAGAVGMIVINNRPGPAQTMGGEGADVTIPCVMVAQHDGDTIRAGLPATGTISRQAP